MRVIEELCGEYKKFLFLGEAGSGKSELALNLAIYLAQRHKGKVQLLDMDQTKPMFRSRDAAAALKGTGIVFSMGRQALDTPVIPHGVKEALSHADNIVVMDIGGNLIGARSIGQFAALLGHTDALVLYITNYYRPFSKDLHNVVKTKNMVLESAGLANAHMVLNPNLGSATTLENVQTGAERSIEILAHAGLQAKLLCVREDIFSPKLEAMGLPVLQIKMLLPQV